MICIVDYGVGNIQALLNLFKRLGIDACRANTVELLSRCDRLVLPGVGDFDFAMQKLNDSGLRSKLEKLVMEVHVPIIGICVGMQMLARGSEEGKMPGLGWIPGYVRAFNGDSCCRDLPMPHMGWNHLRVSTQSKLFNNEKNVNPQFYFLHSYFFEADDRIDVAATAHYGIDFDAVVSRGHIHGVQFHPEKSHRWGEQIFQKFVEI